MLFVSSCGFKPLLEPRQQRELNSIQVEVNKPQNIYNQKIGFLLKDCIERFIDQNSEKLYTLRLNYSTKQERYAIQYNNTFATRQKAIVTVNYELLDIKTGEELDRGTIRRSDSFDIEDSTYSTFISEQKSMEGLVYPMVDQLLLQIASKIPSS